MDIEKLAYNHGANIYENGEVRFYTLNAFTKFAEAYHQVKGNEEIQTLRAKVASADVLVEALRFYADKSSYDCDHDIGMEVSHRVILYKDQYEHNQSTYYAGRRAIEALATYDKLSEVKHDTE